LALNNNVFIVISLRPLYLICKVPFYHCHFEHGIGGRCDGCIGDALVVASPLESLHFHLQTLEKNLSIKVDEANSVRFFNRTPIFLAHN
jgi:hypothetical protein